jgi:hypothetical protein
MELGMIPKGLLTFAFGAQRYVDMARALSLSYRRYSPSRPFAIITDDKNTAALKNYYDIVIPFNPSYGRGVVQKLWIDRYTPFEQTLFVDSDCLFYKNPELVWESYAHPPFAIRGWRHLDGTTEYEKKTPYEWLKDLGHLLQATGVKRLPHFNSGVLFFDNSEKAHEVFREALKVFEQRDSLGFIKFKNAPINDEPAVAVAMERAGIEMLPWDPVNGQETAIGMQSGAGLNVLTGKSTFSKFGTQRTPALIHFNVNAQYGRAYNRDKYRLLYEGKTLQPVIAEILSMANWVKGIPQQSSAKITARYHRMARPQSKRIAF